MAIPASFKCCKPKGIPIIMIKQASAEMIWPIANQNPAKTNQIILPNKPRVPVPMSPDWFNTSLLTASLPKGKNENCPITKQALPQGIPMIVMKAISPTNHQASPIRTPPNKNQSIFPRNLINFYPNWIYCKPKWLYIFVIATKTANQTLEQLVKTYGYEYHLLIQYQALY